jgi:Leucine-rich repeat (LRR) protein
MDSLSTALSTIESGLRQLHIPNNRLLADAGLENAFRKIAYDGNLRQLVLSGCSLKTCNWARYLPFVRNLQYLNLSHNFIDDHGMHRLCISLQDCFSLLELDLSFNRFSGFHCQELQQFLTKNKRMERLHLDGNRFAVVPLTTEKDPSRLSSPTLWTSVAFGLMANKTLMTLSLQDCGINLDHLKDLVLAFKENNSVEFVLHNNPLPHQAIVDTREYFRNEFSIMILSSDRWLIAMYEANAWKDMMLAALTEELESLAILEEQKQGLSGTNRELPVVESKESLKAKLFLNKIWCQSNIEQSKRYRSIEQLNELIQDLENKNTSTGVWIDIAFGREAFVLGKVEIYGHTTYETLREIVRPLVHEHAQTVDNDRIDEFMTFMIIDPNGQCVEKESDFKVTLVTSIVVSQIF